MPTLPKRGFWTRKSVKTTRFTMFSRARSWKTMRFTMFSRVSCVRKDAVFRGICEKHDRFAKNHVFLRVFRRPVALKREFWRANPSETRVLDAQVRENHAFYDVFSRPIAENHAFYDVFLSFLRPKRCFLSRDLRKTRPLRKKPCLFTCFSPAGRVKTRVLACQPFRNAGFGRASP